MKSDIRNKVLQRLADLAAGRGLGCRLLQVEQEISQRRFVRNDKSTASFFLFRGCEHCRGAWSGKLGILCTVFAYLAGFTEGNRNPHNYCRKALTWIAGRTSEGARNMRRVGQNVAVTDKINSGQEMNPLFAIRYSLFAPSRSAYV